MSQRSEEWLPVAATVLRCIVQGYDLGLMGIHGLPHWGRVLENGRRLAQPAGADPLVVDLFALFHDARRTNENRDPGHGARGADLARQLRSSLPPLTDSQFELLCDACDHHTDGQVTSDPTIGMCWDADRLDLWRVGISPTEKLLSTEAARDADTLAWAQQRSADTLVPSFVTTVWMAVLDGKHPEQ